MPLSSFEPHSQRPPRPPRPERTASTNDIIPLVSIIQASDQSVTPHASPQIRFPFASDTPPGSPSSQQDFRPDSSHSNIRCGTAFAHRPQYHCVQPTSHDATLVPFCKSTSQVSSYDDSLHPGQGPNLDQTSVLSTLSPGPSALTLNSRFSDVSEANAVAVIGGLDVDRNGGSPQLALWILLPAVLILSGAVAILMGHSLSLYGGLKTGGTVDNTINTHPVWPSNLSLLPTWLLLVVGFASFCATVITWGLGLSAKLIRNLAGVRIGLGAILLAAWIGALVVFELMQMGHTSDGLGMYACKHKADDSTGISEIALVCVEQNVGFGLGLATALLQVALIGCFAFKALATRKNTTLEEKDWGAT